MKSLKPFSCLSEFDTIHCRKGRSPEEPVRPAADQRSEGTGEQERGAEQNPAGARRSEGAGVFLVVLPQVPWVSPLQLQWLKKRFFLQTASVQAELQAQREQGARLQDEAAAVRRSCEEKCSELTSFLDKYQEKSRELEEARMKLQAERLSSRWGTSPLQLQIKTKLVQQ